MENKNIYEFPRDYRADILDIIRSGKSDEEVRLLLEDYHDNDIAAVLDKLTVHERERLLTILGNEGMSEIVPYLEDAGEYLTELEAEEAADIIEQMDADDALEVLEDLDEEVRRELFELIDDEEIKEDIEIIDSYNDDEFGSKMSTNFISISSNMTVKQAMRALIAEAPENDNIYTLFVVDEGGGLCGAIDLKDLIVARSETPLDDLIYKNFPYVSDKDSISENIERVRGYSEDLIPVISCDTGELLGVITSVDLVEIVDEERGDDYAKLAALSSEEEKDEPLSKSIRKRVPWPRGICRCGTFRGRCQRAPDDSGVPIAHSRNGGQRRHAVARRNGPRARLGRGIRHKKAACDNFQRNARGASERRIARRVLVCHSRRILSAP